MAKILITGGLGYIGSHTAVALIEKGHTPVVVDNLSNTRIDVLEGIEKITGVRPEFHQLDLAIATDVAYLFRTHNDLDGIIHFAAYKAVGESVAEPLKYYNNNLTSLIYLLQEIAKGQRDIPFIFSSSCTVYGQAKDLPITEVAPVVPAESPYGNTKQIGEEIIKDAVAANGIKAIALRYFNPIGAHESAAIGELPLGVPQNLIPFVTQTAAGIREQLSIFGNDYPTRDGTAIRDYIHVVDLAEAHIIAVERLLAQENELPFEVFNLGTGEGSTVLEVVEAFERVSGMKLNYRFAPRRPGDVIAAYADTKKVNEKLGWKAKRSLDASLASAWAWQQRLGKD
ncbi:MAG: UDP-glucose 4-epimerase GalE [Schleiferiaceae bacterium]|nr:UDP-glucose 4-epimerase GalE [Schleiferiaceae bacterium]